MRDRILLLLSCLSAVALPAARAARADWPQNPAENLPVCTASGNQADTRVLSDGVGGVFIAWTDERVSFLEHDLYATHVLASGQPDPAWPPNGLGVCTAASAQRDPGLAPDGAGGCFVVWDDSRDGVHPHVYAQHLLVSGVDPLWPAGGLNLTPTYDANRPSILADDAGGFFVAVTDGRTPATLPDLSVLHVLASAEPDPTWPAGGAALCSAPFEQILAAMALDGAGGVVLAWDDFRDGADYDLYAGRVLSTGRADPGWPVNGRAVATGAAHQWKPSLVADGAGGAFVSWLDDRNNGDVYVHHVLGSGALDPVWPAGGIPFASGAVMGDFPSLVSDGGTGMILSWADDRNGSDLDIFAAHLFPWAAFDPSWSGRDLSAVVNHQIEPAALPDGAGGVIVAWADARAVVGVSDLYAGHVLASGALDPSWPTTGLALSVAPLNQLFPALAPDGSGGAIVAWEDHRSGFEDIFAQRVQRFGILGVPEPRLVSVLDVPNDQGGEVKVSWLASFLDTQAPFSLSEYRVFRSVPAALAQASLARGRSVSSLSARPGPEARLFATTSGATTYYWEYLATQPASHFSSDYGYVAPTASDSMPGSDPPTAFIVVAYDAAGHFFASNPDSGHSVDNLPPPAPVPFTGTFATGTGCVLGWEASAAADVAGYRLYRGDTPDFAPGPSNLIAATTLTHYTDPASHTAAYKLSAVDTHGNEGPYATVVPGGTLDATEIRAARLALRPVWPNPAPGPVRLSFALPRDMPATLAIYDAAGRRVREVMAGAEAAGDHDVVWDLRDDAGARVRSGLYFVRLQTPERGLVRRIVAVE